MTEQIKEEKHLSPSSILTYKKCPLCYYYVYIENLKEPKNIYTIKGNCIHKILQDFYEYQEDDLLKRTDILLNKHLIELTKEMLDIKLSEKEIEETKKEIEVQIKNYIKKEIEMMETLISTGKAQNKEHAWFSIKPKFRELYIKDDKLKCNGYIDRVSKFGDITIITDYKTGKKQLTGLKTDHELQLAIYALLYYNKFNEMPDFGVINYLLYGKEIEMRITPDVLKYARIEIEQTHLKTKSNKIEDYPKTETKLCAWCSFFNYCNGTEESNKRKRMELIKEKLTKKNGE